MPSLCFSQIKTHIKYYQINAENNKVLVITFFLFSNFSLAHGSQYKVYNVVMWLYPTFDLDPFMCISMTTYLHTYIFKQMSYITQREGTEPIRS